MSHPTRVRGLKRVQQYGGRPAFYVAPHAGAWIETGLPDAEIIQRMGVAPHAGAWIETSRSGAAFVVVEVSHPTRVRGLKPGVTEDAREVLAVAPHAGAWIETFAKGKESLAIKRRTPRGCVD